MSEVQPPLKRVRLSEEALMEMKREELVLRWKQQDGYIDFLESRPTHQSEDDSDEKLRQMHSEFTRKEKIQILRLSTKEQEFQELANKLAEISKGQSPGASQLRSTLMDPAHNLLFQRMKKELEDKNKQLQQAQEDMSAWKFTSDSQTGKRLMARCRTLLQENQDLGKQVSSGKIANLDAEIAMQKQYNEELKGSQDELYEMVVQLNEEGEGMQSTICALQQQLKDANQKLSKYEVVVESPAPTEQNAQIQTSNKAVEGTDRTDRPSESEETGDNRNTKDSEPMPAEDENVEDKAIVTAKEDNTPEEISKEPRVDDEIGANPSDCHENDERNPATDPSNRSDDGPENRTSGEGPTPQVAFCPERSTDSVEERTSPAAADDHQSQEEHQDEPMETGESDGRTTPFMANDAMQPQDKPERTTTANGDDAERTPPVHVAVEDQQGSSRNDDTSSCIGLTEEEVKPTRNSSEKEDHESPDFRTTNIMTSSGIMTPDSPPQESAPTGDVQKTEPISDHVEDKDRTETLDRTVMKNISQDDDEKMEVTGKDAKWKFENEIVEKGLKNNVITGIQKETAFENVISDAKMNSDQNLRNSAKLTSDDSSNDNTKSIDENIGSKIPTDSNCYLEENHSHCDDDNPASPENNGEVTCTPLSPQSTEDESEPVNVAPDGEYFQPRPQSGATVVDTIIKTTNGVQKDILSKETTLPVVHSPEKELNCTLEGQEVERTNGPQQEGDVRTDSPKGNTAVVANE